jgi:hypothetical protein
MAPPDDPDPKTPREPASRPAPTPPRPDGGDAADDDAAIDLEQHERLNRNPPSVKDGPKPGSR